MDEFGAAVDESGMLGAVVECARRNAREIWLIGLAEVCGVGVRLGALFAHPCDGRRSVETAGEGDADALANGQGGEHFGV